MLSITGKISDRWRSHPCHIGIKGNLSLISDVLQIIIYKYIDKLNHGEPTLKIDVGDSVVLYRKYFDVSGLYEYCQVGDSVSKQSNALEVFVKRGEYRRSFIVDFDCEKL